MSTKIRQRLRVRWEFLSASILLSILVMLGSYFEVTAETESTDNIGLRTEDPGPFLRWPLEHTNISAVTRLPDSPWTHTLLGITNCPPYPAMINGGLWDHPNSRYDGTYGGNRSFIRSGVSDDQVKWQNRDNTGQWGNIFACYGANSQLGLPDHAGTDISTSNRSAVFAAADADQIQVVYSNAGEYRIRLRHPNVNGSGQTWYTFYVHLNASVYGTGTQNRTISAGTKIGETGTHLHFQPAIADGYRNSEARNPWGMDQSPWGGCLWIDRSLCQEAGPKPKEVVLAPATGHFSDVSQSNRWFPYIETLHRIGAVQGFSGGLFKPQDWTARDQAAKMISLGLGRKPNYTDGRSAFDDVPTSHPFYQYIRDLKELGITQGYQNGRYFFDPTKPSPDNNRLTRCQTAAFIVRARGEGSFTYTDGRQTYRDVPPSHSCYHSIERLHAIGASPYDGSTFSPDAYITRELMSYAIVRALPGLMAKIPVFKDVAYDSPFYPYIESIKERGITNGCDSTLSFPYQIFCPNIALPREQAAAFLSRAMGFTPYYTDGRQSFLDVVPTNTFYHVIEHMRALGVVQGYSSGNFGPRDSVTRRQLAQMIVRGFAALKISCPSPSITPAFPDVGPGSEAYAEIQCLKDLGITSGFSDGRFKPDNTITRAEAAKLVDLAFVKKVPTIEQEPEERINDRPSTAPVIEPVPAQVSDPTDDSGGAPIGINLSVPNESPSTTGGDLDIVQIDLEPGKEYEAFASEVGENGEDIALTLFKSTSARAWEEGEQVEGIPLTLITDFASDNERSISAASFTVPGTGRYYIVIRNKTPYSVDGVNLRFGVREVLPAVTPTGNRIYLPSIRR